MQNTQVPQQADTMMEHLQPLLTIEQVAEILGVTRPTVYKLIHYEGLPVVRLLKNVRIIPSSFQLWLSDREEKVRG